MVTRRNVLKGAAVFAGGAAVPLAGGAIVRAFGREAAPQQDAPQVQGHGVRRVAFDLAERPTALPCFGGKSLPLWTFQEGSSYPVVRLKLGETLETTFRNNLPRPGEYATIHWHGLRIPNVEDGVPFLTQHPIEPGQEGKYSFTPPETGTFFFHTHCNSVEHFGRGLFGVLIVEGDESETYDDELVLVMKDWRVSPEGTFLPFSTDDGAARAGTSGTIRSVNGETAPAFKVPASANVRIRFLNVDPVRISEVGFEDADAALLAVDGNGLPEALPLESWRLGPAQRLDIVVRTPAAGGTFRLMDFFSKVPVVLAEFHAEGEAKQSGSFAPRALKAVPYAKADVAAAEHIPIEFSATPTGEALAQFSDETGVAIGTLCLSKRTFWAINKQAWVSVDHSHLGPPVATLQSGKSYVFELRNTTPHAHPIHIHGHTFEVLDSNLRKLPKFRADTVLLLPKERIEVALVGGLPGKWMFHCHILEHQETGMMGYILVT